MLGVLGTRQGANLDDGMRKGLCATGRLSIIDLVGEMGSDGHWQYLVGCDDECLLASECAGS